MRHEREWKEGGEQTKRCWHFAERSRASPFPLHRSSQAAISHLLTPPPLPLLLLLSRDRDCQLWLFVQICAASSQLSAALHEESVVQEPAPKIVLTFEELLNDK